MNNNHTWNLVVIGGGPGGYEAALEAAGRYRMKTVLIERSMIGGTCLAHGCIPTKVLLHASGLYREMLSCGSFGLTAGAPGFDMDQIRSCKDSVLDQLHSGILSRMEKQKVTVLRGSGCILDPHTVSVTKDDGSRELLDTAHILIATGSRPAMPPIPGLDLPGVVSSNELLEQGSPLPSHLVIIGGGVIGVEFASIYSDFGAKVTMIEALPRIIANMEKELSQSLKMLLKKRGVDIHTGSSVREICRADGIADGKALICRYEEKGETKEIQADRILVCTGRKPCTDGLFSEKDRNGGLVSYHEPSTTGDTLQGAESGSPKIRLDRGFIRTDGECCTGIPGIYAIGDVTGGLMLAHAAAAEGKNAVASMAGADPAIDLSVVPSCIYTDPEIASVGLTIDDAKDQGIDARSVKYPMSANGKTLLTGQERGFIKVVYENSTHRILGAQMMCARASDMITEFTAAIVHRQTLEDLAAVIRPHPTFCEAVTEAVNLR